MILPLFRFVGEHPQLLITTGVVWVILMKRMSELAQICESRAHRLIPDLNFGYTPQQLNEWYEMWGEEGRRAYTELSAFDLFPFMWVYVLFTGSLWVRNARRTGWYEEFAYSTLAILGLDIVETVIQRHGNMIYPARLPNSVIVLASVCCQLKWSISAVGALLLLSSFGLPGKHSISTDSSVPSRRHT